MGKGTNREPWGLNTMLGSIGRFARVSSAWFLLRSRKCQYMSGISIWTFISPQYEQYIDRNARRIHADEDLELSTFYGRLDFIIECNFPRTPSLRIKSPTRYLLAVISPCKNINGHLDARNSVVMVSDSLEPQTVINLQAVQSVIGRIQRGKEWGIIDRSEEMARTVFVENDDLEWYFTQILLVIFAPSLKPYFKSYFQYMYCFNFSVSYIHWLQR